jgi:hypothetical protein
MTTADTQTDPTVYVDPCPGMKGTDTIVRTCGNCGGDGVVHFGRVVLDGYVHGERTQGRVCFDCDGSGKNTVKVSSLRATAHRHVKQAVAAREAEVLADISRGAWRHSSPDLAAALDRLKVIEDSSGFYWSLYHHVGKHGGLTDKQGEAMLQTVADHDAREAAKAAELAAQSPVVTGRQTVTGEVLARKTVDGYAYGSLEVKLLVRDDRGFKVYGTCPKSLLGDWVDGELVGNVQKGDHVTFVATLEASRDDEAFGFFRRPTAANIVAGALL